MPRPAHITVFRFSALGDVAMTVPVIKLLLEQYPELQLTYVSNGFVQPFFSDIERLQFIAADLRGEHKGIAGLYKLSKQLRKDRSIDAIADLHNVLRTKILRGFFSFSRIKTAVIDKGRKEKARLTRISNKDFHPLKSTFERYAEVFGKLGYPIDLNAAEKNDQRENKQANAKFRIGIAPFAKHLTKQYPLEKMKEVVRLLEADKDKEIIFFGGKEDLIALEALSKDFSNSSIVAGKFSLGEELKLMETLHLMVSMDSANMHLASLVNTPVVSIWGGTHPYAGFYGWQQDPANAVQVDLYCRPCSVFGKRSCYRKDLACLHSINPVSVYDRIIQVLYRRSAKEDQARCIS